MKLEELKRDLARLNEQLADLRGAIARNYAPRSEIIRQRRRAALVLLSVMVLLLVGGYVTQQATLAREHRLLGDCFLTTSNSPAAVRTCERAFPGYGQIRHQQQATLRTFTKLQERVANLETQQHH